MSMLGSRAYYYHARGQESKAEELYEKAFRQDKLTNIKHITAYGVLLMRKGEFEKAINLYTRALRLNPKPDVRSSIRVNRAIAYLQMGDYETAKVALEELHEKYRSSRVYQALGYLYVMAKDEKAESYLLEALDYDDSDYVILDNLAQFHIGQGEYEKARPYLEQANDNQSGKVDVLYHLAQVEQAAGNIEVAMEHIEEAEGCTISAVNDATAEKIQKLREELTPQA